MKPQSRILKFYKENLSRFENLRVLPSSFDKDIEELLQDSKHTAWPALAKLCEGNKDMMFTILSAFVNFHITSNIINSSLLLCKYEKTKKVEEKNFQKNIKRDVEAYVKRLTRESIKHINKVKSLDLNINENKLIEKAIKWVKYKGTLRYYEMQKYDDAINFVSIIDPEIDCNKLRKNMRKMYETKIQEKPSRMTIDDFICITHSTCKDRTELKDNAIRAYLAMFLNSLNIKTKTKKTFTSSNIYSIIKRAS